MSRGAAPGDALDLSPELLEAAAVEIARTIVEWREDRVEAPVIDPQRDPAAIHAALRSPLPLEPTPMARLLEEFRRTVLPSVRRNDSPRMFGYICSGGSDAGALADFLASGLNQNVTAWRSAPSATEMERLVVDWLREIVGMPAGTAGLLVGGGSTANLTALAAARDAMAGADVSRGGMIALAREMTLYASDEVHMSVPRAASLLGIGRDQLRILPTGADFRIDLEALRRAIADDREAGRVPFCVVANAGSTNTGAIDPLDALADLCEAESLWLHADAAYGGFAALAPSLRDRLHGLGRASSIAIDPHKWLHVPFDCGAVLVRDAAALRAPFAEVGAYARSFESGERDSFAFFEQGPELSRRFRALKVWMVMRLHGLKALGAMIEHDASMARRLAEKIETHAEMELLAPVPLGVVCFRYAPAGASEGAIDTINRGILKALQREGAVYPTHAEIKGRFALRACLLNPRVLEADLDLLLREVQRHGRALAAAGRP